MVANATSTETKTTTVGNVLAAIKNGHWSNQVAQVRQSLAAGGKDAANAQKKLLPAVMYSGVFARRSANKLKTASGLLCLDLDGLNGGLELMRGSVNTDPHTVASFVSPSGTGLKVIVRVPADPRQHKNAFVCAQNYYRDKFKVEIDRACSDISRLCFVSHDPALFSNEHAAELPVNPQPHSTGSSPRTSDVGDEPRIREALDAIPASVAHDIWVRILMALHHWDESLGKPLARAWSASCPEKFKEPDFETAWRSLKPDGGVGLGTLFEVAKSYGWKPKTSSKPAAHASSPSQRDDTELPIPDWPAPPRPEAFHGVLGDFVRLLEPHTEADPMAIMIQFLVGFGNVIGRSAHFEVEADRHHLNLNTVIVGNSSKARKGTSWGHVSKVLIAIDPTWPSPITGLSTGEGLIHQVRDPVKRTNKEGEEEVMDEGQKDKRLLVVESEFARLLQCASRDGNTITAVIRQAFDHGDLHVVTKSSPERSTGAHISIIGHITTIELNLRLTKSDCANGLANRFLWVAVKRSKLLPEGGHSDSLDFRPIIKRLSEAVIFARRTGKLARDEQARELWKSIYTALSTEQPGLLGSVCSRAEAITMRLATLLAVTDLSPTITCAHLKAALAIWDYCAASAKFIFGKSLGNPVAERVLAELKLAGDSGVSLTGIYDRLNGHVGSEELHAALEDLHSQGLARFATVKTSGRPGQVWFATRVNGERSEESGSENVLPPQNTTTGNDLSSHNSLNSQPGEWEQEI